MEDRQVTEEFEAGWIEPSPGLEEGGHQDLQNDLPQDLAHDLAHDLLPDNRCKRERRAGSVFCRAADSAAESLLCPSGGAAWGQMRLLRSRRASKSDIELDAPDVGRKQGQLRLNFQRQMSTGRGFHTFDMTAEGRQAALHQQAIRARAKTGHKQAFVPKRRSATQLPLSAEVAHLTRRLIKRNYHYYASRRPPQRKQDLAWAAGFIDGDGCISISAGLQCRHGLGSTAVGPRSTQVCPARVSYVVNVSIYQNCRQTLEAFRDAVGIACRVCKTSTPAQRSDGMYRISYHGDRAYDLLCMIRPFLRRKQLEATLGIEMHRNLRIMHAKSWQASSTRLQKYRAGLARCMSSLK